MVSSVKGFAIVFYGFKYDIQVVFLKRREIESAGKRKAAEGSKKKPLIVRGLGAMVRWPSLGSSLGVDR